HRAAYLGHHRFGLEGTAVGGDNVETHLCVDAAKHLAGHFCAGDDQFLFGNDAALGACTACKNGFRGGIAAATIFFDGEIDERSEARQHATFYHSSTDQPRCLAARLSRRSGLMTRAWPTRSSMGKSL